MAYFVQMCKKTGGSEWQTD